MMIMGIVLAVTGVIVLAVSQLLLRRWIKKYNEEWLGGTDKNDMP